MKGGIILKMKTLNIPFEDEVFDELVKIKRQFNFTWRGLIILGITKFGELKQNARN